MCYRIRYGGGYMTSFSQLTELSPEKIEPRDRVLSEEYDAW